MKKNHLLIFLPLVLLLSSCQVNSSSLTSDSLDTSNATSLSSDTSQTSNVTSIPPCCEAPTYNLEISEGKENLLVYPTRTKFIEGELVEIKSEVILDAVLVMYINGSEEGQYGNTVYENNYYINDFSFEMPAYDVSLTFIVKDGFLPSELIFGMQVNYDYGNFRENQATKLIGYNYFFFDPLDYDMNPLIGGDYITFYGSGELLIEESYPGRVVTDYLSIDWAIVEYADVIEVSVVKDEGEVKIISEKYPHLDTSKMVPYVITDDIHYEDLDISFVGQTLYVTLDPLQYTYYDPIYVTPLIHTLYSFNPRQIL